MAINSKPAKTLWQQLKDLARLYIENAKLTLAEKLTLLFVAIAFYSIAMLLLTFCLVFLSIALAKLLSLAMAAYWAYIIIAAFYFLLLAAVAVFKQSLLLNPISRFISKLLIDNPDDK